jgi:diguanylate cyclase (GGDEF)-like protein
MFKKIRCLLPKNVKSFSVNAIIALSLMFIICFLVISALIIKKNHIEKLTMERFIAEKSIKITEVIPRFLYKTQVISAIIMQNHGDISGFERIAATVVDDPAIRNILVAPSGVVSKVYPLEGNEAVLGMDCFTEGKGYWEAIAAKETGKLILGGQYPLVQGGHGLIGRLPVFLDAPGGGKKFWGLVSITLRYPQALEAVGLDSLEQQGFTYEIWRINPHDKEKQIIAENSKTNLVHKHFIERHLHVLNADWYFRISITREWFEYPENWAMIVLGMLLSFLIALIVQNNHELRTMRGELEYMAHMDVLTGIYNRRYFMESAKIQLAKAKRSEDGCYVIIFDLDFFKKVNDSYGHAAGDMVLKTVAQRVKSVMRPYDLLARYGGEEFIVMLADIDEKHILNIAENYRLAISEKPVELGSVHLSITASFGAASALAANGLESAIKLADEALYRAKEEGRNRVCLST